MAWLEKRSGSFHICFRFGDQKFKRSLKTTDRNQAESTLTKVERRLKLIEDGDLVVPGDADLTIFVSDGKLHQPVVVRTTTLGELIEQYRAESFSNVTGTSRSNKPSGR